MIMCTARKVCLSMTASTNFLYEQRLFCTVTYNQVRHLYYKCHSIPVATVMCNYNK